MLLRYTFVLGLCAAILFCCGSGAVLYAVPIVANGDFETNANLFNQYPGYVGGNPPNPAGVVDFNGPVGGYGLNGGATTTQNPFADNGNDTTAVLFEQSAVTLTQSISGFIPGNIYQLSFDYNARNCCGGTPSITVSMSSDGIFTDPSVTAVGNGNPYHHASFNFIATATDTLSISKGSGVAGDSTAMFDNFTISYVGVPEPSSIVLCGLGAACLIGAARRRRAA
jgi:PEP-CTERM motif